MGDGVSGEEAVVGAIFDTRAEGRRFDQRAAERFERLDKKLQYIIDTPRREKEERAAGEAYQKEFDRLMPQRLELIRERMRRGEDPHVNDELLWELAPPGNGATVLCGYEAIPRSPRAARPARGTRSAVLSGVVTGVSARDGSFSRTTLRPRWSSIPCGHDAQPTGRGLRLVGACDPSGAVRDATPAYHRPVDRDVALWPRTTVQGPCRCVHRCHQLPLVEVAVLEQKENLVVFNVGLGRDQNSVALDRWRLCRRAQTDIRRRSESRGLRRTGDARPDQARMKNFAG